MARRDAAPVQGSSARSCWRSRSISTSSPRRSTCQKAQPLQAGAPCTWAATEWIEPRCLAEMATARVRSWLRILTGAMERVFISPGDRRSLMRGGIAGRATENEVAFAACQIAATRPNGVATFRRMKTEIPNYLQLSAGDRRRSQTRPNEQLWEQLIRNIKSHSDSEGNSIYEGYLEHVPRVGYRITSAGRQRVQAGMP